MEQNKKGCVCLVGAGCGSADLITVRGLGLLRSCDAVVYDELIDPALLEEAEKAEKYPAGKRCGRHSMPQEETNELLIRLAKEGKKVVRLKGGDPFVFGRGGEEILALKEAGIDYEEVPGISSSIAIPAAAGIPVTHREVSRSFHVITGHTNALGDTLPESVETLASLKGTLVFLMGLSGLEAIADRLMKAGKDGNTPAAVISGGNSPHKVTVRGTLSDIAKKTRAEAVKAPAVIVVGDVAALDMGPTRKRPLEGVTAGLVGTPDFVTKLEKGFRELGAGTLRVVSAKVRRLFVDFDLKELEKEEDKWVVLTSSNGVRCFFEWLREEKIDLRCLSRCKFAVIGAATGKTLEGYGIFADLYPETATSKALAESLCGTVKPGERVLLFRSALSDKKLAEALEDNRIPTEDFHLYDTVFTTDDTEEALDYLIFGSGCGVESYFKKYDRIPEETTGVCIGPVSGDRLKKYTGQSFLTAPEISVPGILQCVLEDWEKRKHLKTD